MPEMTPLEAAEILQSSINIHGPVKIVTDELLARATACDYLRKIAAGEYVPVVHARWVNMPFNVDNDKYGMNKYNMRIKCTNCGFVTSSDLNYLHCPVCAAIMDGKDDSHVKK